MSLIEIDWKPDKSRLRTFGLIAIVVLAAASIILRVVFGVAGVWALVPVGAGACVFIISRLSAGATRIVYLGLTFATLPIGLVISFVLMATFYFIVLTPVALVFKLLRRDPLARRIEPDTQTYWTRRRRREDIEHYFHQS